MLDNERLQIWKMRKSVLTLQCKTENNIMKMDLKYIMTAAVVAMSSLFAAAAPSPNISANSKHASVHANLLKQRQTDRLDEETVEQLNIPDSEFVNALKKLSPESSEMIDRLLEEARAHLGTPYVFGAKGPTAFDCSGFTSYVYNRFEGQNIPSYSRAQYTLGTPVELNSLRKGDLVFFTSRRSGSNVGHVGMVVEADNENGTFKFIHASTKRGVVVSDFEGYYVQRYVGARRLINE